MQKRYSLAPLAGLLLAAAPRLAHAQTGSVGIGTTAPNAAAALEIKSTSQGLLLPRLSLTQRQALTASPTAPPVPGLVIYQTDNAPGLYAYDGAAWVRLGADNLGNHTATQNLDLGANQLVGNGGSQGLNIASGGNVGIGTAPLAGLHVDRPEGGGAAGGALGVLLSGGSSGNPSIELRGSGKSPYIDFVEASGVDYSTRLISQGGTLNLNYGGPAASKPTYVLSVDGGITASGQVRANGVVLTSDARFKQHVRPLSGALAAVLALRGVRYEWNALGIRHGGTAGAPQVGVLAQEVEKVYPELVSTDQDGYKAVNYAQLTPVLLEAIKEQQAQIRGPQSRGRGCQSRSRRC